jgi:Zn-dependent alcohol dehydrogenase
MAVDELPTRIETEGLVVMKPGADFVMTPIVLDEVRDDELLIEMKYSGICHTVSAYICVSTFQTVLMIIV